MLSGRVVERVFSIQVTALLSPLQSNLPFIPNGQFLRPALLLKVFLWPSIFALLGSTKREKLTTDTIFLGKNTLKFDITTPTSPK